MASGGGRHRVSRFLRRHVEDHMQKVGVLRLLPTARCRGMSLHGADVVSRSAWRLRALLVELVGSSTPRDSASATASPGPYHSAQNNTASHRNGGHRQSDTGHCRGKRRPLRLSCALGAAVAPSLTRTGPFLRIHFQVVDGEGVAQGSPANLVQRGQ
jgi:hypothetical protein